MFQTESVEKSEACILYAIFVSVYVTLFEIITENCLVMHTFHNFYVQQSAIVFEIHEITDQYTIVFGMHAMLPMSLILGIN
jgi:hypothetical protein